MPRAAKASAAIAHDIRFAVRGALRAESRHTARHSIDSDAGRDAHGVMNADTSSDALDDLPPLAIVDPPRRLLDGFTVARALPARELRMVGPFAFLDHLGPAGLPPGQGLDVRPHPHIHLSTVTYLFEGAMHHRDSLGSSQLVTPGAINWMTAGRGIVHSERSPAADRAAGPRMHGLQIWVASPVEGEDVDPSFSHHPAESLPTWDDGVLGAGVRARLLAGDAYGVTSAVPVQSPLVYLEVFLDRGARLELPAHAERAIYVLSGEVALGAAGAHRLGPGRLAQIDARARALVAEVPTHLVVLGGAPIGPRFIWWNFASSRKDAIIEAAKAWRAGEFPVVPGDEAEFIPLETLPHFPEHE